MKYNSFLAWTSVITKLYLPLRTPRKPEEFKVTMCVAVVTTSGVAVLPSTFYWQYNEAK